MAGGGTEKLKRGAAKNKTPLLLRGARKVGKRPYHDFIGQTTQNTGNKCQGCHNREVLPRWRLLQGRLAFYYPSPCLSSLPSEHIDLAKQLRVEPSPLPLPA